MIAYQKIEDSGEDISNSFSRGKVFGSDSKAKYDGINKKMRLEG